MSLVSRVKAGLGSAITKMSGSAGPLPSSFPINWFQTGLPVSGGYSTANAAVEACVAAYSQTISQCAFKHFKIKSDGSYELIRDSNVAKILNKPNDFQTPTDIFNNLIYGICYNGNGYIFSLDDPTETDRIYLLNPKETTPEYIQETGDIYYSTGGQFAELAGVSTSVMIPSRFVGQVRLYTPYNPLIGVSPIQAAAASIGANNAIVKNQASFFENMRRPSGVLTTDMSLKKDQILMLREAWDEQAKNMNSGGVPILSNGLKWDPLSITSQDAQLVEAWRMTVEDISRVFRVPKVIINSMENSTFSNVEQLMSFWLSSGLGFMVGAIEQMLRGFFRLPPDETIECDTDSLLRSDLEGRVNAYGGAVTKGLMSPNEARRIFRLPPVDGGDEPRVQQQMVPLSWQHPEEQSALDQPADQVDDDQMDDEDEEKSAALLLPLYLEMEYNKSLQRYQGNGASR